MDEELIRRAEDLARRCTRSGSVTSSLFLTPAQAFELENWAKRGADCQFLLHGGYPEAERRVAFFLPDWMEPEAFEPEEHICALRGVCRFGAPGHRDYLGAILALGIGREWLGDILIEDSSASILCLPSVKAHLLLNLDKVGSQGVTVGEISLSQLSVPERQRREMRFSIMSPRLDAVCAGMFRLSRSAAAQTIAAGLVSLNYSVCLKPDAPIRDGDVLSLRGKGKGIVTDVGSNASRKGRLFVTVELYQ